VHLIFIGLTHFALFSLLAYYVCIICAYTDWNISGRIRFDLIINGLYENEDENKDYSWMG
jgi:hypothetical protein